MLPHMTVNMASTRRSSRGTVTDVRATQLGPICGFLLGFVAACSGRAGGGGRAAVVVAVGAGADWARRAAGDYEGGVSQCASRCEAISTDEAAPICVSVSAIVCRCC